MMFQNGTKQIVKRADTMVWHLKVAQNRRRAYGRQWPFKMGQIWKPQTDNPAILIPIALNKAQATQQPKQLIYGPSAKRTGHKIKTRIRNLQYGTRTRLVRCLSYRDGKGN